MNTSELFERHFNPESFVDSSGFDEQAEIAHANKMYEFEKSGDTASMIAYLESRTTPEQRAIEALIEAAS